MNESIVLVEDDLPLAQWMVDYLWDQVLTFITWAKVVGDVKHNPPDVGLLDWMLPGKAGLIICRELRAFYQAPVLMLTLVTQQPTKY
mgnify:CR=1 FL=1